MRTIHFVSGLPRAGSTLLCNVLAQNPRFHTTATSGILDVLFAVRNHWHEQVEFQAMPEQVRVAALLRVQRSILDGYFADIERPIVFDKSRGWLAYIEMAEAILERPVKILVPVRDLRDVLASFEKLWRAHAATRQIGQERANYFNWQTTGGRCQTWMQPDQPLSLAYNRIHDALQRGFDDRLFFVDYDRFCKFPGRVVHEIYDFLDEPEFEHDYDHVEQVTSEDDSVFGFGTDALHSIRTKIEPQSPQWPGILGEAASKYKGLELW